MGEVELQCRLMAASIESTGSSVWVALNLGELVQIWYFYLFHLLNVDGLARAAKANSEVALRWRLCTDSILVIWRGIWIAHLYAHHKTLLYLHAISFYLIHSYLGVYYKNTLSILFSWPVPKWYNTSNKT